MEKSYIDMVEETFQKLQDLNEEIGKELLYFPDLLRLLCNVMDNDIVDRDSRILITSALGYMVVPNDIVPEEVYGPYGYMDDMYVACYALNTIAKNYPDLVARLWNNDVTFKKVLKDCTEASEAFLDERGLRDKLLRYAGFSD